MKLKLRRSKRAKQNKWRLRRVLGAPRRLARRRGFGVHSPFAFDFIRRVISQPCDYYCYPQLASAARLGDMRARHLKLIFRLALHFRPQSVSVTGCREERVEALLTALRSGSPDVGMVPDKAEMYIMAGNAESVAATIPAGCVAVFLGRDAIESGARRLWAEVTCGMMFRGSDIAVYVGREHLPRQMFNVWM